jgi:hypothetical protein
MNCCDDYGNCTGTHGCAAHTTPVKKPAHPVWAIYLEALVFFVGVVMFYVTIVTWGNE